MNPDQLADIANFSVGVVNYLKARPGADDEVMAHAMSLFSGKKTKDKILNILEWMIPFLKENNIGGGLHTALQAVRVGNFHDPARLYRIGVLLGRFLSRLRQHQQLFKEVFGKNQRAKNEALNVILAYEQTSEEGVYIQAKTLCTTVAIRTWLKKAANSLGLSPSPSDELLADTESAQALGEKLQKAREEAATTQTTAPLAHAEEISQEIEALAQSSSNPNLVWQAALSPKGRTAGELVLEERWRDTPL